MNLVSLKKYCFCGQGKCSFWLTKDAENIVHLITRFIPDTCILFPGVQELNSWGYGPKFQLPYFIKSFVVHLTVVMDGDQRNPSLINIRSFTSIVFLCVEKVSSSNLDLIDENIVSRFTCCTM